MTLTQTSKKRFFRLMDRSSYLRGAGKEKNKAAGEMKERIQRLLDSKKNRVSFSSNDLTVLSSSSLPVSGMPFAGTFHSLCVKILRVEGNHIGIPDNFAIYDDNDQQDCIKDIMKRLDISTKNFNPGAVLHTISETKSELVSALEYPQYARGY